MLDQFRLEDVKNWWQNLAPEIQTAIQQGSLVLVALLGGHILGGIVTRALRAKNFDAALRLPSSSPPSPGTEHGFTPSSIAGTMVRLTVWAVAGWWLARQHGRADIASLIGVVINRVWALAAVLVPTLAMGSLLANRLIDSLHGLPKLGPEPSRNGSGSTHKAAAGLVGAGAYVLSLLLVLLVAADMFDWPLTRSSTLALWQLAQHLLVAAAALFIGCLGARWARELGAPDGSASPEKRAGQYTALGVMATTTLLAVTVLLASTGVIVSLTVLVGLGVGLWLVRGHLPDVAAGLQLRANKLREVQFEGESWQVVEVGLLTTQVGRAGEICRVQNRLVLQARMRGAPLEAVAR
jgi:hypothetical protein